MFCLRSCDVGRSSGALPTHGRRVASAAGAPLLVAMLPPRRTHPAEPRGVETTARIGSFRTGDAARAGPCVRSGGPAHAQEACRGCRIGHRSSDARRFGSPTSHTPSRAEGSRHDMRDSVVSRRRRTKPADVGSGCTGVTVTPASCRRRQHATGVTVTPASCRRRQLVRGADTGGP